MNIIIPVWLIWAAINLLAIGGGAYVLMRRMRLMDKRHTSETQACEDDHVATYERMTAEIDALQAKLDGHATLWLAGRHVRGNHWDVQGIFTTRALAVAACKNRRYFIFALDLDQELPEESTAPFKLEYPKEVD